MPQMHEYLVWNPYRILIELSFLGGAGFDPDASLLQGFCKNCKRCLQLSGTKYNNMNVMHKHACDVFVHSWHRKNTILLNSKP